MNNIVLKLKSGHLADLIRGGGVALGNKIVSMALGFILNLILARKLGADGSGSYFLVFSYLSIAVMIGRFGSDKAQLVFLSKFAAKDDWQKVSDYYDLLLGEETGRYIFRILALKEIMNHPEKYGFDIDKEDMYIYPSLVYLKI